MSSTLSYTEEIVPIERLKEDEEFRSLVPPNNMKEQLASSIAKNGQTLPIDVDSDYVILDGYTRISIMKNLNFKEVKVRKWNFKSSEDRVTAYKLISMLNLQRRHLEKNEVLKLLREIAERILREQKKKESNINLEQNKGTEKNSVQSQKLSPSGDNLEQNSEINIKPRELETAMKQIKDEGESKVVTDSDIQKYSIISTIPYLRQLVDDGKISLRTAYELYTKAKDKLQKIANLPSTERNQLLTTKEGRKIILERDDLLQQILDHKMAVSQAINKLKVDEKLAKSKRKPRAKDEYAETDEEEFNETEEGQRELDESNDEEYPFVEDWKKASEEEEAKQRLTPQFTANISGNQNEYLQELDRLGSSLRIPKEIVSQFNEKGFFEILDRSVIAKIEDRIYVINEDALRDLEQGRSERWKELTELLSKANLIVPDEGGIYTVMWRLMCKCQ
ncbi:ParB N-terminal domain-containing protein [Acidianus sp. HS-5]|uniref:ParB N-terminal domain-containing protein n=1 Tax=Acidianus sp. HS-5 TaxID=2886040 RepID=UPI001F19AFD1|nr:ParB N-terminal domain-containing protein [Acidianus sp. HS-5]BDC18240.1 hypothetical protein HS5_11300 [Acidianus sp. HS-5]